MELRLFLSDSWFYEQALVHTYGSYQTPAYKGRGLKPLPIAVPNKDLAYAQVHKEGNKQGKITKIFTRIVLGNEITILNTLADAARSKTINTDYVESRNEKYRKSNARLTGKTLCHSKKAIFHKAHINLLTQVMNYTWVKDDFKVIIHANAPKFEQKYQHKTSAMKENLIDKVLTVKQLLLIRPIIKT